jgi:hypothetical protein
MTELREKRFQLIDERRNVYLNLGRKKDEADPNIVRYIFPCPVDDCRGFIEAKTWTCGICEARLCSKCHIIKKKNKKGKFIAHECNEEDLKSSKLIMKSTKACPACSVRIYRSEGCPQMFCTSCHVGFNWNTGKIDKGVIHNPHYFEYQRQQGIMGNAGNVNMGDNANGYDPCANNNALPDLHALLSTYCVDRELFKRVETYFRLMFQVNTINTRVRASERTDFLDIRVRYVNKEIADKDAFKRSLFIREKNLELKREKREILSTFVTTLSELVRALNREIQIQHTGAPPVTPVRGAGPMHLRKVFAKQTQRHRNSYRNIQQSTIKFVKVFLKGADCVLDFCNTAFIDTYQMMGHKVCPTISYELIDMDTTNACH